MNHLQSENPKQVEKIPVHLEHEKKACALVVKHQGGMQCLLFGVEKTLCQVGAGTRYGRKKNYLTAQTCEGEKVLSHPSKSLLSTAPWMFCTLQKTLRNCSEQ